MAETAHWVELEVPILECVENRIFLSPPYFGEGMNCFAHFS